MSNLQQLIDSLQYFAAVGKIVMPLEGAPTPDVVEKVSGIVRKAVQLNCTGDLRKIMKQFEKWVDRDTTELAVTLLSETTDIDPMPDEFHPDELV
jgi:hypothetical protein